VNRGIVSAAGKGASNAFVPFSLRPASSGVLQRKCDCGQHTGSGECEECKKKKDKSSGDPLLLRSSLNRSSANTVPPIVHGVLRSAGQPLDASTRAFFEPRFGQDFSRVRVHADPLAAESASAVNASAYAYGNHIVFGKNQFSPGTALGRSVLAHELVHVAQAGSTAPFGGPQRVSSPNDASESEAEAIAGRVNTSAPPESLWNPAGPAERVNGTLSRLVGPSTTHCVPNKKGVPADPLNTLTAADARAKGLAEAAAILFGVAAAGVVMGITSGTVNQVYQNRFGLPPKKGTGFLNRLTGKVAKTQNDAMQEELQGISDRFDSIDKNFGRILTYRCIDGAVDMDGCKTHCSGRDASACSGASTFFLCPTYWGLSQASLSTLLIHESFHMLGHPGHGGKGVGKNLRHAECYASAVSDIFNLNSAGTPACPSPPE
jgi:Domain of unknown function (DUF4157)